MTRRERNILYAGIAMAVVFVLARGVPLATQAYAERREIIAQIRDDIAREQRLLEDSALWLERRESIEERLITMDSRIFQGASLPLLTANIQRMVREYATETGIMITSTNLATTLETTGWLLVEQELSFTMNNQSNTLGFLQRLESAQPYLGVSSFSMRRNRNQYMGTVTVVGFSRLSADPVSTSAENERTNRVMLTAEQL